MSQRAYVGAKHNGLYNQSLTFNTSVPSQNTYYVGTYKLSAIKQSECFFWNRVDKVFATNAHSERFGLRVQYQSPSLPLTCIETNPGPHKQKNTARKRKNISPNPTSIRSIRKESVVSLPALIPPVHMVNVPYGGEHPAGKLKRTKSEGHLRRKPKFFKSQPKGRKRVLSSNARPKFSNRARSGSPPPTNNINFNKLTIAEGRKFAVIPATMRIEYTQMRPIAVNCRPPDFLKTKMLEWDLELSKAKQQLSKPGRHVPELKVDVSESTVVVQNFLAIDVPDLEVDKRLLYYHRRIPRGFNYRPEKKYLDGVITSTSITSTGTTAVIFNIPQGDAQGERVGDQVYLKSLKMSWTFAAANADVFSGMMLSIVKWIPNISLDSPNWGYFFSNASQPTESFAYYPLYGNYHQMWKHKHEYTGTATVPTVGSAYMRTFKIKLGYVVTYLAGSSSASTNTLLLNYVSDSFAPPYPTMQCTVRVEYYDC